MGSRTLAPLLTRRRVLGVVVAAGSALGLGVGGIAALRGTAPPVEGLRVLSAHEYRTLSRLAEALFPAGGAFEQGAGDADLARMFDDFLADEPEWNRSDLKNALFLLELAPVIDDHRAVTFSHLAPTERLALFTRWREGTDLLRRQAAGAFHRFLGMVFYDREEVWPALAYEGPIVKEPQ
jgi:hypothetical protein